MMNGWDRHGSCINFPGQPLYILKCLRGKLIRNRLAAREIGIYNTGQLYGFSCLLKLVVNPRMIAPESSHSDDRYADFLLQCLRSRDEVSSILSDLIKEAGSGTNI